VVERKRSGPSSSVAATEPPFDVEALHACWPCTLDRRPYH